MDALQRVAAKMRQRYGLQDTASAESVYLVMLGLSSLFRDVEAERDWLRLPLDALGGRSPAQALDDGDGERVQGIVFTMCGWR